MGEAAGETAKASGFPASGCPIGPAVEVVFSRWTTPILWHLQQHGPQRFTELRDRVGAVTAKVLTQRLRYMERDGLVARTRHAEVPPRVEYELTDLGRSLAPVFAALATWSDEHFHDVARARAGYDRAGRPLPA